MINDISVYNDNTLFISPLTYEERYDLLKKIVMSNEIVVPESILRRIIELSGGIPEVSIKLLYFFIENNKFPNIHQPDIFFKHFDTLFYVIKRIEKLEKIHNEIWKLIIGMFSTGKSIDNLYRTMQMDINERAILIRKLGLNYLVKSSFIRSLFFSIVGYINKENFLSEGIWNFLEKRKEKAIWTSDFDIRYSISLIDYVVNIMKDHSIRVDWENLKINNKQCDFSYYGIQNGDKVKINLSRRITREKSQQLFGLLVDKNLQHFLINFERNKNYSKRRTNQSKLIYDADTYSRKGEWKIAENLYKKAINIKTDASWPQVRLANLFRMKGNYKESREICRRILISSPNPYASLCIGICYYFEGDIEKSLSYVKKAIDYKNDYINSFFWASRCSMHLNKFSDAQRYLELRHRSITQKNKKLRKKHRIQLQILFLQSLVYHYQGRRSMCNIFLDRISSNIHKKKIKYTL